MILWVVTVMIVFVNIAAKGDEDQRCPVEYSYDTEADLCYLMENITWSWQKAREACQRDGADLVMIFGMEKQNILKKRRDMAGFANKQFWIGVSDVDMTGMYEYVNGTMLKTEKPGLGQWSQSATPSESLRKKRLCVALDMSGDSWVSVPCDEEHFYVCEKLQEPVPIVFYDDGYEDEHKAESFCSLEECSCQIADWNYYKARNIYVKVNKVAANFTTSAMLCEKFAGELLIVRDKATHTFIKTMKASWDPMGVLYWIGLTTKYSRWTWINGKQLHHEDYKNWFREPHVGDECVAVAWDYWGKWRGIHCETEHYHVCQAREPCSAYPLLTIDGKVWRDNATVRKTNDQESTFTCELNGYKGAVQEILVVCDGVTPKMTAHESWVDIMVRIDIKLHRKQCTCQIMVADGTIRSTTVFIDFKTRPCLVEKKENDKTFALKEGVKVVHKFDIYANPKPRFLELLKNGEIMDQAEYIVTLEPLENPVYYKVMIEFEEKLSALMTDRYTLPIVNDIKGTLEYSFTLEIIIEYRVFPKSLHEVYIYLFSSIMIIIILSAIFVKLKRFYKGDKVEKKKKSEEQEKIEVEEEKEKSIPEEVPEEIFTMDVVDKEVILYEDDVQRPITRYGRHMSTSID